MIFNQQNNKDKKIQGLNIIRIFILVITIIFIRQIFDISRPMWNLPSLMNPPTIKLENNTPPTKLKQQYNIQTTISPYLTSSFFINTSLNTKQLKILKIQSNPSTIQPSQNQYSENNDSIDFNDLQIQDEDYFWGSEVKHENNDIQINQMEEQSLNQTNSQLQDQTYSQSEQKNCPSNKSSMQENNAQRKAIKEGQSMQLQVNPYSSINSIQPNPQKQRRSTSSRRCLNRKIRTTITRQKLKAINQIFAEYSKQKEEGKNPKLNLKQIGKQLCLGYSTILHKYRQFRSSKCVKGGALIASLQKKRKYKKSLQIEKIIEQALSERPFYTAVQLSSYIHKKHAKKFSRSIISRHLGEMGYSYKNITNNPLEKNKPKYKQIRRIYAVLMMPIVLSNTTVVYIDELACSLSNFMKRKAGFKANQGRYSQVESDYISIIAGVSVEGVLYFEVKMGFITRQEFCRTIVKSFQRLRIPDKYNPSIQPLDRPFVITDMNKIHRDPDNGDRLIATTLARFNANRYFLPPISYQLSPLDSIFMNLKHRLWKRDIQHIDELKDLMIGNMNQIMRETTEVYFKDVLANLEKSKMNQNL